MKTFFDEKIIYDVYFITGNLQGVLPQEVTL